MRRPILKFIKIKEFCANYRKIALTLPWHEAGHAMEWNAMENGMEWKENFGMKYGRCSEWNGMEDLKNGTEDRLPYFHTCLILSYTF